MKTKRLFVGVAVLSLLSGTAWAGGFSSTKNVKNDTKRLSIGECLRAERSNEVNLSEEEQRECDLRRFGNEPHFNRVHLTQDGVVRAIHLIETETGRTVFSSFPYGLTFASTDEEERQVRMKTNRLESYVTGRRTPGTRRADLHTQVRERRERIVARRRGGVGETPVSAKGLSIGWNDATGPTSGMCFNYKIDVPGNNVEQISFSSQNTAGSTSQQINISSTITGGFSFIKANTELAFSDEWEASSNSSDQYYNIFSLFTLNLTIDRLEPLNSQGQSASTIFDTLCGNRYMASVPGGMVATLSVVYGSSSSTAQTNISSEFGLESGLNSITGAVEVSTEQTNNESYFTFILKHYGGGDLASLALHKAYSATNEQNQAYYALCAQGDTDACQQFNSNLGVGATEAIAEFRKKVSRLADDDDPDISFFATFPNGVAGASVPQVVTEIVPRKNVSEVLGPFASELRDYLNLVNGIRSLDLRVDALRALLAQGDYNPVSILNLDAYLNDLANIYGSDASLTLQNLATCLNATSDNVETVCAPIITNTATNAFDYYAADPISCAPTNGQNRCVLAGQNTLALQYTAIETTSLGRDVSRDVLYIDTLPKFSWAVARSFQNTLGGQGAIVSFADRAYIPCYRHALDLSTPP